MSNLQKQLLAMYARLRVAEGLCRTQQEREPIDALQWLLRDKSRKESARLAREKFKRDNRPGRVTYINDATAASRNKETSKDVCSSLTREVRIPPRRATVSPIFEVLSSGTPVVLLRA